MCCHVLTLEPFLVGRWVERHVVPCVSNRASLNREVDLEEHDTTC
jgi:hypothetical protein